MNIEKILCPIDFSDFNHAANELASAFAQACDASIVYLTVPEQKGSDYEYAMQRTADRERVKLKQFKPTEPDIKYSYDVRVCSLTAEAIVEYAKENDIDLIVLATHGRTGLRRIVMGSVAEAVVRKATCPVLTLKSGNKTFADSTEVIANTVTAGSKP